MIDLVISGLVFVGYISDHRINGGALTPHFEFAKPADGKRDINTLDGWNAAAEENAVHNYRKLLGREPPSIDAAMEWQMSVL